MFQCELSAHLELKHQRVDLFLAFFFCFFFKYIYLLAWEWERNVDVTEDFKDLGSKSVEKTWRNKEVWGVMCNNSINKSKKERGIKRWWATLHGFETVAAKKRPASSVKTLFIQQFAITWRQVYLPQVLFWANLPSNYNKRLLYRYVNELL